MAKLPKFLCRLIDWLEEPEVAALSPEPKEPSFLEQLSRNETTGEKRAISRKRAQLSATLIDSIDGTPSAVSVENLSEHGLYIVTSLHLAVGSVVEVRLRYPADADPGQRHVSVMMRVVRVETRGDANFGIAGQIVRCRTLSELER